MITTPTQEAVTFPTLRHQALALARRGGTTGLSAATIPGATSDLKAALAWQLVQQGVAEDERWARYLLEPTNGDQRPADVSELLAGTVLAARRRAEAAGARRPGNAGSRVLRLLQALNACAATTGGPVAALPRAWQRVDRALEALVEQEQSGVGRRRLRAVMTGVRNLGRCAAAYGQLDPAKLPADPEALRTLLRGWSRKHLAHDVWVLRTASRALTAVASPDRPVLPTWSHDPEAHTAPLNASMPRFMRELRVWHSVAGTAVSHRVPGRRGPSCHTKLRPATQQRYRYQVLQWAHAYQDVRRRNLIPDVALPPDLTLFDAWVITSRHRTHDSAFLATSPEVQALRHDYAVASDGAANRAARPLALVVVEVAVAHGIIGRYQLYARTQDASSDVEQGALPPAAIQMLFALAAVTERVVIALNNDGSEMENQFRAAWEPTARGLKAALNTAKDSVQQMSELLTRITLPQLICCVLPWRTLVDLPRRQRRADDAAIDARAPTASAECQREAGRARAQYHRALRRWVVQASLTADPVRIRNAWHARMGREVVIDATWSADGSLATIDAIRSTFRGHDQSDVSQTESKNDTTRGWYWSPMIMDYQWAATYLLEIWWPTVQRLALVPAGTPMRTAIESGTIAWLLNPEPRSSKLPPVAGAYLSRALSDLWAEALLEGLEAMGRSDLPRDIDDARRRWPWLFGPHKVRHLWATYWWGVRSTSGPRRLLRDGMMEQACGRHVACRATGDKDSTLEQHYVRSKEAILEAARHPANHFDHPSAYHSEMDRTWWLGEQVDWAARWRDRSFPLPTPMRAAFARLDRTEVARGTRRLRRRRTAYVLPDGHARAS